jgi:hypothetical protein
MTPLENFVEVYGIWIGLVVYILLKDVVPFLFTKFIPGKLKAVETQRQERVKELSEERVAVEGQRKERADELLGEREWQHKLELDRAAILTTISNATQALAVSMAQTNTNIVTIMSNQSRILTKQDTHHDAMMEAVGDMRAKTKVATGERSQ